MVAKVFYVPGATYTLGEFRTDLMACAWSGETLDQLQAKYPAGVVGTVAEFEAAQNPDMATAPVEITEKAFFDALCTMPPQGWLVAGDSESFKFLEHYSGQITTIYARIGKQHWRFMDVCTITHSAIIEKIRAHNNRPPVVALEEQAAQ